MLGVLGSVTVMTPSAWTPRLCETTGVAHSAAAVRYDRSDFPASGGAIIGFQTRCRGSYLVQDQYVLEMIPASSPIALQVTCIECLAVEP